MSELAKRDAKLARAIEAMQGFGAPWGVAGGWAVALFVGREIRPHADVDIAIFRGDQARIHADLRPTVARRVIAGVLEPSPEGEWLALPVHEVHLGWADGFELELLLNERDDVRGEWVFRRDARVRRPLDRTFVYAEGVPCLAPEIVLLYKSKSPAAKDDADLAAALPNLSVEQRRWLRSSLDTTSPGHRWSAALDT